MRVTMGLIRQSVSPLLLIDDKHKLYNIVITAAFIIGNICQGYIDFLRDDLFWFDNMDILKTFINLLTT